MPIELNKDDIKTDDLQLKMVLSSISQGNTEGHLWRVEDTFLLWDKGNVAIYIFGDEPEKSEERELSRLFETKIIPDARKENFSHFKLNELTETNIFKAEHFKPMTNHFYISNKKHTDHQTPTNIKHIDEEFLKDTSLENLPSVINEIKWMWPSFKRFYEKGFGKATLIDDKIVCWCTAEYVSESMCGIGIETLNGYRQKGIGTQTAKEFLNYCFENKITACWECNQINEPSIRLAEKLNMELKEIRKVLLGRF